MLHVNITIHQLVANVLSPHYCCSCGRIGQILCASCKYDISSEPFEGCLLCHKLANASGNLCGTCKSSFSKGWVVGERNGALKVVIDQYKFERVQQGHVQLVSLIDAVLPILPPDTIIAPVPTIAKHIRMRGYDHMQLIGRALARKRGLPYSTPLKRISTTVQQGASRQKRLLQAQSAFTVPSDVQGKRFLVVDDIVTTGSTLEYASRALLAAGASEVWVAVIAAQPLEKA